MEPSAAFSPQHATAIEQRLRPADRGAELRADAAAGREHARAVQPRQIEDDADVAPFAHAPDTHHGRGQRLVELEPESEHQRTRPVVHREAVERAIDVLGKQGLGNVVATRAELVEHLALGYEPRLLQLVERTRALHDLDHPWPVDRASCGVAA